MICTTDTLSEHSVEAQPLKEDVLNALVRTWQSPRNFSGPGKFPISIWQEHTMREKGASCVRDVDRALNSDPKNR